MYYKINSYLHKIKDMPNVLVINLEDTQKDMGKNLLNILQKSFNITLNKKSIAIYNHTKNGKKINY